MQLIALSVWLWYVTFLFIIILFCNHSFTLYRYTQSKIKWTYKYNIFLKKSQKKNKYGVGASPITRNLVNGKRSKRLFCCFSSWIRQIPLYSTFDFAKACAENGLYVNRLCALIFPHCVFAYCACTHKYMKITVMLCNRNGLAYAKWKIVSVCAAHAHARERKQLGSGWNGLRVQWRAQRTVRTAHALRNFLALSNN